MTHDEKKILLSSPLSSKNYYYLTKMHNKILVFVLEGHHSAWHEQVQTLVVGGVSIRNQSVISN